MVEFGGTYLAQAKGYFADAGLNVDILPGGPDLDPTTVIASGAADIGLAEPDAVARANANGADLVIIGATFQKNPLAILSKADDPILKPSDMYGKTIAVPALDQPQHDALVAMNNLDASKITTIPGQFDVSPITSGQADGLYVYYTEQPISLEEAGIKPATMLLADYGEKRFGDVYVTSRKTLQDKFDMLVGFMGAQVKGWTDYVADQSQAVDLSVNTYGKDAGLSTDQQTQMAKLQVDLISTPSTQTNGLLSMSADDIKQNLATFTAMGVPGADASLFDSSVLDAVYAKTAK
jgi:ABC-type nitrate/sulfonate/bicarbonate transport system substrate-binding protein